MAAGLKVHLEACTRLPAALFVGILEKQKKREGKKGGGSEAKATEKKLDAGRRGTAAPVLVQFNQPTPSHMRIILQRILLPRRSFALSRSLLLRDQGEAIGSVALFILSALILPCPIPGLPWIIVAESGSSTLSLYDNNLLPFYLSLAGLNHKCPFRQPSAGHLDPPAAFTRARVGWLKRLTFLLLRSFWKLSFLYTVGLSPSRSQIVDSTVVRDHRSLCLNDGLPAHVLFFFLLFFPFLPLDLTLFLLLTSWSIADV